MKITNILLSLLFFLFAIVQFNDPDPWLWILFYGYIAVISGFAAWNHYNKPIIGVGIAICVIGLCFLLPEFVNWLNSGAESIVESMKAEKPHIELTREFLGLSICLFVLVFHWRQATKLLLLCCLFFTSCFQPEEGCLDIEASNFALAADRDCVQDDNTVTCPCDYPSLNLVIDHVYNDQPYLLDSIYQNDLGQTFRIEDIQFYISNIRLMRSDSTAVKILDTITLTVSIAGQLEKLVAIDDFKIIQNQTTVDLGSINTSGTFQQLAFIVGIKEPENTANPEDILRTSHSLLVDSMYTESEGYIFNRFVLNTDTSTMENTILHITNNEGITPIVLDFFPTSKEQGKAFSIDTLQLNHAKWFDGINFDENTVEEMRLKIVTNTTKVFSIH